MKGVELDHRIEIEGISESLLQDKAIHILKEPTPERLRKDGVRLLNARIGEMLKAEGAPDLDGFYFCPHHPNATLPAYRQHCACRKPEPGLILQAARDHDVDPAASYVVGDRPTDILAGHAAGCRTVLVRTGAHEAPLIETAAPIIEPIVPDYACTDLAEAAAWILEVS
jgi:D-glycero-D-manno-heptose 1,7-bisphosphate phosphatase